MEDQIDGDLENSIRIVSRALAYIAMQESDLSPDAGVLDRARFLMRFGLSRADAARLVGSSDASIAELERQARKGKGKSNEKTKKR
jgi:hypothetical protein